MLSVGILIGLALRSGCTCSKHASYHSFATQENLVELQLSVNESLRDITQQVKDGDENNRNLIQQLTSIINNNERRLNSSQIVQESVAKSSSDQLSKLQKQVDGLNSEIHQPVNLYENCKEETAKCTIDPVQSKDYWRDCATLHLPLNKEVCDMIH